MEIREDVCTKNLSVMKLQSAAFGSLKEIFFSVVGRGRAKRN